MQSRTSFSRHFVTFETSPDEVIKECKKLCNETWEDCDLWESLCRIGRVMGSYGDVRFRVERVGDRRITWFLSNGKRFAAVPQKDVLQALKNEAAK